MRMYILNSQSAYVLCACLCYLYQGTSKTYVKILSESDTFWHKLPSKVLLVLVHNYVGGIIKETKTLGAAHIMYSGK